MKRRPLLLAGLVATAAFVLPASAQATFTPFSLVSTSATQQMDDANDPASSADGRYVAMNGTLNGVTGVYRKDLRTGDLALVAGGTGDGRDPLDAPDAGAPSISGDGRLVVFTTRAHLDPVHDHAGTCSSVYVRDMDVAIDQPGAFTLVSALDGSDEGITFAESGVGNCQGPMNTLFEGALPIGGGAAASDHGSISDDGSKVVFTVVGQSDLTTGDPARTTTPAGQVAVRYLATRRTQLITQTVGSIGGTPVPVANGGALGTQPSNLTGSAGQGSQSTASISPDGSTVAWMGFHISAQTGVPTPPIDFHDDSSDFYAEPLWRHIADGPSAPIRNVLGGEDPLNPAGGPLNYDFASDIGGDDGNIIRSTYTGDLLNPGWAGLETPRMDDDGMRVAVLSNLTDVGQDFSVGHNGTGGVSIIFSLGANAFVANMSPGVTREQGVQRLTQFASTNIFDPTTTGGVTNEVMSPDGSHVAFTTQRNVFALPTPALITPPISAVQASELYDVDLNAGTMQLASVGFDGLPANATVVPTGFSRDGKTMTIYSNARNLVFGTPASPINGATPSGVYQITDTTQPPVPGASSIAPPPAPPALVPDRRLGVTLERHSDGSLVLDVTTPGAGTVSASATAPVPVRKRVRVKVKVKAAGKRRARTVTRLVMRTVIVKKTVSTAKTTAAGAGLVKVTLRPAAAYRALAATKSGLDAAIAVTFAQPGQTTLAQRLQAGFPKPKPKLAKRKAAPKAKPKAKKPAAKKTAAAPKTAKPATKTRKP